MDKLCVTEIGIYVQFTDGNHEYMPVRNFDAIVPVAEFPDHEETKLYWAELTEFITALTGYEKVNSAIVTTAQGPIWFNMESVKAMRTYKKVKSYV